MFEWTVRESVVVKALEDDATKAMFVSHDYKKAVVVRIPSWDSIGTVYFNEAMWFTGYGQSQIRHMIQEAVKVGGEVEYPEQEQVMSGDFHVEFIRGPI